MDAWSDRSMDSQMDGWMDGGQQVNTDKNCVTYILFNLMRFLENCK